MGPQTEDKQREVSSQTERNYWMGVYYEEKAKKEALMSRAGVLRRKVETSFIIGFVFATGIPSLPRMISVTGILAWFLWVSILIDDGLKDIEKDR